MKLENDIKELLKKVKNGEIEFPKAYLGDKIDDNRGKMLVLEFTDNLIITFDGICFKAISDDKVIKLFLEDVRREYKLYKKGLDNNYREVQRKEKELIGLFMEVYKRTRAKYNIAHKLALEIDEETVRESKVNVNNLEELREKIKKIRPTKWRGEE